MKKFEEWLKESEFVFKGPAVEALITLANQFAKECVDAERERCAKVADDYVEWKVAEEIAEAIRQEKS